MSATRVRTTLGDVEGLRFDGYERYAGIRYAEPPTGPRRFRAPIASGGWDGVYDATAFGAAAPQAASRLDMLGGHDRVDEDCLFLNVYTPAADDARRPVLVWIHGGAYTMGSGELYDGAPFCRRGDVVVVTVNYRLGALGWLPIDAVDPAYAGAANNGIRDQICALRWVRDHIEAFGGDPDRVTVAGESAGAGSVLALVAAPEADGLFARAIAQSPPAGFGPRDDGAALVDALLAALGSPGCGVDALLDVAPDALVAAQASLVDLGTTRPGAFARGGVAFRPVVDGVVVTATAADALAAKGAAAPPLLAGTNRDEGTLFAALLPSALDDATLAAMVAPDAGDPARAVAACRAAAEGRGAALVADVFGEAIFRIPTIRAVSSLVAAGGTAWLYRFDWATAAADGVLGATHALELPFVWDMLGHPRFAQLVGGDPPQELAAAVHEAWTAFVRDGAPRSGGLPPWPPYDLERRATMRFDDLCEVVDDLAGAQRAAWG